MLTVLTQIAREESSDRGQHSRRPECRSRVYCCTTVTRSRKMARPEQLPERKASVRPRTGLGFWPIGPSLAKTPVRRHRNSMIGVLSRAFGCPKCALPGDLVTVDNTVRV